MGVTAKTGRKTIACEVSWGEEEACARRAERMRSGRKSKGGDSSKRNNPKRLLEEFKYDCPTLGHLLKKKPKGGGKLTQTSRELGETIGFFRL